MKKKKKYCCIHHTFDASSYTKNIIFSERSFTKALGQQYEK